MDLGCAGLQRLTSGSGGDIPIGPASPVNDYIPNHRALRNLLTSIEDATGLRGATAVDATRQRLGSLNQLNEVLTLTLPDLAVRNLSKTTDALLITPGPASEQISDLLFNWQAGQRERLIGSAERGMGVGSDPVIFEQQMKQKRKQLDPRYQAIQNDLIQKLFKIDPLEP